MMTEILEKKQRLRAPSQRSLETRKRILDAAEQVFAAHGFEGASIREIAEKAGVQGALVHHHGGKKTELFFTVVSRRADELSALRLAALQACRDAGPITLRCVIASFVGPFLKKTQHGGPEWLAYGRLIAHVSSDERWRPIAKACFDPTAEIFLHEISQLLPNKSRVAIGAGFVFMVSSMLSVCTSKWRIDALSGGSDKGDLDDTLLDFFEAGFLAAERR